MDDLGPLSGVRVEFQYTGATGVARFFLRDELTQADYEIRLPAHLLPVVRAMIDKALADRPDLEAVIETRRFY